MPTTDFAELIVSEQQRVDLRCAEIDETVKALESERDALEKRKALLETAGSLYQESQQTIEDSLETQLRLHPASQYENDAEDGYKDNDGDDDDDDDDGNDNEPNLRSVS